MKKSIIYLLMCFTYISYAQYSDIYGEVEYSTILEIGSHVEASSKLFFSSTKSCFIEGEFDNSSLKKESTRIVYHDSLSSNQIKYYTDLISRKIFKHHLLKKNHYLIEEDIFPIEWSLYNEYKSLMGYNCQKAVGKFRGRKYVAWFAADIPIGLGPWKLNGLPGLILQANDTNNQINFFAQKLVFLDSLSFDKNRLNPKTDQTIVISIKKYLKIIDKLEKEEFNRILASMPRGYTISGVNKSGRESKMEIIYEWEKINEKE